MIATIKTYGRILLKSARDFMADDALKFSASLSYYTVFSIAPVLIIIIGISGLFFGREAVTGEVFRQFSGLMGARAAALLQDAISNVQINGQSVLATVIGVITLIIGSTGVFTELQDSLNKIWSLKAKPKSGLISYLTNRLLSFSMILTLGFLLIVSLLINAVISLISENFFAQYNLWAWLAQTINIVMIVGIITVLFAFIFKFLPDVKLAWRDVWVGALFTTVLFLGGKFAIGFYLSNSAIATTFGAAGSLALMLAWVYYSSAILFFGAEFTKNYALHYSKHIMPDEYASFVVTSEKELSTNCDAKKMDREKEKSALKGG